MATVALSVETQLHEIDMHIKELSEMLPYTKPETRKMFMGKINEFLDERLELMERCPGK